jgi:peptidoglycan/LPS O-acetylase OafA/YrhL
LKFYRGQTLKLVNFKDSLLQTGAVLMDNKIHLSGYRKDIDGLRTVAILLVVFYHFFPQYLSGGFIGVDIFFVISGFLITRKLLGELNQREFDLKDFYTSRMIRTVPPLIAVLLVSISVGWLILLKNEFSQLGSHITAGTTFVSNFTLLKEAGYFDTESELKPLLHLWSLGVEWQFYLTWPILLGISFHWKR